MAQFFVLCIIQCVAYLLGFFIIFVCKEHILPLLKDNDINDKAIQFINLIIQYNEGLRKYSLFILEEFISWNETKIKMFYSRWFLQL